jgi:outer membrane protein OmpA-like peptidoglycan-associated protein
MNAAAPPVIRSPSPSTSSATSLSHRSAVPTTRCLLVRQDGAGPPFVWAGLWPLLGLLGLAAYALLPFARNDIESTVHREVQSELNAKSLNWVNLKTSGQNVLLTGSPPDDTGPARAVEVASGAMCPTWLGLKPCVVRVFTKFGSPAVASAAAAQAAAPVAAAAQAQACEKALADQLAGQRIEFASGSARITDDSFALLDRLAAAAKSCPAKLRVEGHTDNVGNAAANQRLSQARAEAVQNAMAQRGVAAEKMQAQGFGAERPVGNNDSAEGRASNRRIEFRAESGL